MSSAIHQYVAVNIWSEGGFRQRRSSSSTFLLPRPGFTPRNIWPKLLPEWQHSKYSLLSLKLSLTHSCPALDPPQGRSDKKPNTCAGNANLIPTKFHKYQSSGSVVKADYLCSHLYTCISASPLPSPK